MTIKEARQSIGLSQSELSAIFDIPIANIKSWDCGRRKCPEWCEPLLVKAILNFSMPPKRNISIKDARKLTGLSQQKVTEVFGIPVRTLQNWELGNNLCPEWCEILVVNAFLEYAEDNKK